MLVSVFSFKPFSWHVAFHRESDFGTYGMLDFKLCPQLAFVSLSIVNVILTSPDRGYVCLACHAWSLAGVYICPCCFVICSIGLVMFHVL